jgi:hypothetical protein
MTELHETVDRKFVESFDVSDWEVETDTGWVDIEKTNKTIEYDVWRLELDSGKWLECADNHIVFRDTKNGDEEVFVKDLVKGDYIVAKDLNEYEGEMIGSGKEKLERVKSVKKLDRKEHMYDLTVGGEHTYFTNGILSHNTMILGNTAVNAVKSGKNVLYISFEIDQRELRKRLDATFADLDLASISGMREQIKNKVREAKRQGKVGRMIIKEFPPASVSALDVENYLFDLKLKKDFEPDLIVLDYLGIMKPISNEQNNSYEKGKAVCEEIRALSDKFKCPILSASQSNRGGYGANTVEMDNIADSMGIAHTADLLISLAQTEELKENSQIKFDIIKSRISRNGSSGIMDVDYTRLRLLSDGDENETLEEVVRIGMNKIEEKSAKINTVNNNDIT